MYLTWNKGTQEWGTSEQKPKQWWAFDVWGPFLNLYETKQKEYELRGLNKDEMFEMLACECKSKELCFA